MIRFAILLLCSFISFCIVSADMSNITIDVSIESWISMENFKITIEESLPDAKCTNILISGESDGTVKLFNEFVKIHRSDYTVNTSVYECTGYFVISSTVERLVTAMPSIPTATGTTEILIIVDDHVEESTKLFDVPMYDRAQVNIVAHNGMWTLSENYVYPRLFKKVSSPNGMKHKRGIVDLQGQELQIAAFYKPPFSYLLTTVNRTVAGIEAEFFVTEDNEAEVDGVEVQLFLLIAKTLNFTWSIRKPKPGFHRYGKPNGSNWTGGILGLVFDKEVDMAFTHIWLLWDRSQGINLTTPWEMFDTKFLVPRPKPYKASFWALTKPLSSSVWYALVAMLIVQSVYVYTSAWINPRIPKRFRSFTIAWTEMMGRLVGTCAPPKMESLKLLLQLWHFIGILMVTGYSSSLAAKLTNRGYDKRIDTVQQFLATNLTWGRENPSIIFSYYCNLEDPYESQLPQRYEPITNEDDIYRKMKNGNYAPVGIDMGSAFFPDHYIRRGGLKGYRVMKQSTTHYYSTFAVQPWLLESVNMVMLWLQQSGLVKHHLSDVLHRRTPLEYREVFMEYDVVEEGPKVLELIPLGIGLCLFIIGLLISTVVFYLELRSVSGSRSISEVLIDIKKNREIRQAKEIEIKRKYRAFRKFYNR